MSQEYYLFTKSNIRTEEINEAWDKCLEWVQGYLDVYGENRHTAEMKELRERYTTLQRDSRILRGLQAESRALGNNLKDARQVFINYLSAYPDTTIRKKVELEIEQITQQMNLDRIGNEEQRARDAFKVGGERFVEAVEGVVNDKKSGLMWSLLDSKQATTRCFDYGDAKAHVENLVIGEYSDWRLPTIDEMNTLYNGDVAFPGELGEWFWTVEEYTRYADGWITEVRTLERSSDTQWITTKHDARYCGSVRAVRP
jgi:hypothetical protein